MRQCPDRYTIRAGRNLPDKEFRYLRTVIVTAAVYWGFNSMLAQLVLTFEHRAGVSPYTSSFDLAETCVFAKQSPGPIHCGHVSVASLFPKLRDQFAEFLNYPSPAGLRILFLSTCCLLYTSAPEVRPSRSSPPRVHIDGEVWHLDVGSSHPGAVFGPKGSGKPARATSPGEPCERFVKVIPKIFAVMAASSPKVS